MPGREPDCRLMIAEDNGKGRVNYFRLGAGWLKRNEESGEKSLRR